MIESEQRGRRTIDLDEIRAWAEERGGVPAIAERAKDAEGGDLLRIVFDDTEKHVREVPWEDFFAVFEANKLVFVYDAPVAGEPLSLEHEFAERTTADIESAEPLEEYGEDDWLDEGEEELEELL